MKYYKEEFKKESLEENENSKKEFYEEINKNEKFEEVIDK